MQRKDSIWKLYGLVLILVIGAVALGLSGGETNFRFTREPVTTYDQGWKTTSGESVDLPKIIPAKVNEPIWISRELGADFDKAQVLCIRGSMQTVRAYLDGKEIYENLQADNGFLNPPRVSVWNFIHVPEGSAGKEIKIEFTIDMKSLTGHFGNVFYGNESALKGYIIYKFGSDLPLIFLIFVMGLVFFTIPLIFKEIRKGDLAYLGLFSMGIAIWFFEQGTLMQFITGNVWALGGAGCLVLSLFIIPLLIYARNTVAESTTEIFNGLIGVFAVNAGLVLCLQLFGIVQLYDSLILTHSLYGVAVVVVVLCFVKEIKWDSNEKAVRFLRSLVPLAVCTLIEISSFYIEDFHRNPIFVKLGLLLFLYLQAVDSVKDIVTLIKKSYVAEMYQKLAFEDRLTGGANRMAFEQAMEDLFADIYRYHNCRLIIFDLNSLKRINDNYGHNIGDQAITAGFSSIKKAFQQVGECYRIGGDEFACICPNCDEKLYIERMEILNQLLEAESKRLPYPLSIAAGSAVLDPKIDRTVSVFIHRADMDMYEDKLQYTLKMDTITPVDVDGDWKRGL